MGFLEEVVRETRRSIDDLSYGRGLPEKAPRRPASFRESVARDAKPGALVVEFKRVSPGRRESVMPSRSLRQFLESTTPASPSAFSCLATVPRFEGSPKDVAELAASTERPVLFKDFVVDTRQVEVAARTGAGAILLIARLATQGLLSEPLGVLADAAHHAGLEVLLEFHARAELSRAADVAADVYGVNARDLDTLSIDRETAISTLREAAALGHRPLLGFSGVESAGDARRFWDAGADGILVGSSVARAAEPALFLRTLRRPSSGGVR